MTRILFVTSNRLGDAVLSSGLLTHLAASQPDPDIWVACGPVAAPLFRAAPGVSRVLTLRKEKHGRHWLRLWRAVVARRWDLVVDLRDSALGYLVWTRRRLRYRATGEPEHRVVQLGRLLGISPPPAPALFPDRAASAAADNFAPPGPFLALGPTANWPGKAWPGTAFAELARRLTAPEGPLAGAGILLLGAPGEEKEAAAVAAGLPGRVVVNATGKLDPLASAAVLSRAMLFIGNDSGLMHMAAAAGIPTLGLFGPSREVHYHPWGPHCAAIRGPRSFEEIVYAPGYDFRAATSHMTDLSVEKVFHAAAALLDRTRAMAVPG